ncbi:hypothetical protein SAMN06265182_1695 [Persephonella hydrogeniphila]|uniref:Uncharacterized protein n=1 Tax=Persephonella hydrogeniphila TaxID=198703 RepID=A0A285NQS8_9AQUI|nr:hypothetical protein [Persephonella hydrogeniphila]SNZ09981.1 hypothetical protein SAMN06265182_1695 [Persephonella hydrogeniphila]
MRIFVFYLLFAIFISYFIPADAQQVKITNEMIYQKLIEIEKRQAIFEERFEQIDKRLEFMQDYMDERFKAVDKRFESIDKRFMELRSDINARFDQLYNFLWIITCIFTTLTLGVIGFAYWNRKIITQEKICLV